MNASSILIEPAAAAHAVPVQPEGVLSMRPMRLLNGALLAIAAVFFALHFVHLRADFPNHSLWMDWAKYTDEGWYGDAAIRHYQLGHWNVPGDFNPAAALPVWPLMEMVVFRVTGVSLVAARALTLGVFGLILLCGYRLIRRWPNAGREGLGEDVSIAPAVAVMLLAVSPFCFVFFRLAILEPMLILSTLAGLLAATEAGAASVAGESWRNKHFAGWTVALGLVLPTMVLTKTTGVFLFPTVFWMLWAACGYRVKPFLRVGLTACGLAAVVWGGYYGLFVRPHYLADYKYLFSANAYTGVTLGTLGQVLLDTVSDGSWIGDTLFGLALAAIVTTVVGVCVPRFRSNPLAVALVLWVFGYGAFLAYHDNLQPRYYLVLAVPLSMLVAVVFDAVLAGASHSWLLKVTAAVGGAALVVTAGAGAWWTVYFVSHPEYTFLSAANQIRDAVDRERAAHPEHSRMVLSISGSDLALMTGLPAICDDFGTLELPQRVAKYRPGWFATWNDVEDDKMEALAPLYRLVRVAEIPAFDDPERNLLILYRLDPLDSPGRMGRGRRRSMAAPRRPRAKVIEQPSAVPQKR
jgi:hypothetical protein